MSAPAKLDNEPNAEPPGNEPEPPRGGMAPEATSGANNRHLAYLAVAGLLVLHAGLLCWAAVRNSVAYDEFVHLAAGVEYWEYWDLSIYNQSPPLLRWWGGLPAALAGADAPVPDSVSGYEPDVRYWVYGQYFLDRNFARYQTYFLLGRLGLIPLSCLGGWIVYRFAAELYQNRSAGVAACAMYSLCPTIAGQASLVGTDAGSAVAMLAATWLWWRFCREPSKSRLILAGVAIGLAHLCKFYAVLLWPMAALTAAWFLIAPDPSPWRAKARPLLGGLATCALMTWFIINLAYVFHGTMRPISSYSFSGTTLRRVASVLPGSTPLPLPANYIDGFDAAQAEVQTQFPGYLLGETYRGARWDFYPIALACKLPLATLALLLAAGVSRVVELVIDNRRGTRDDANRTLEQAPVFIALITFVIGFVILAKINIGIRYLLPAFPLAFILAARLWMWKATRVVGWALLSLLLVENLHAAPRYVSFYNLAAGRGYPIVSDFDWGQSLIDLRDWMRSNGVPRVRLAYNGRVDPAVYGIDYIPLVEKSDIPIVAISGYYLTGQPRPMRTHEGMSHFVPIPFNHELMARAPLATLGSILVYKIADFDSARQEWELKNPGITK